MINCKGGKENVQFSLNRKKKKKKKEREKTVEIRGKAGEIKSYLNSRPRIGGEKKGKGGGRLESRHFTSNMDEYKGIRASERDRPTDRASERERARKNEKNERASEKERLSEKERPSEKERAKKSERAREKE